MKSFADAKSLSRKQLRTEKKRMKMRSELLMALIARRLHAKETAGTEGNSKGSEDETFIFFAVRAIASRENTQYTI